MAVSNVELIVDATKAVNPLKRVTSETQKLEKATRDANGQLGGAKERFQKVGKAAGTATGNIQRMGVAFRTTLAPIVATYGALNFLNRSLQVASERQVDVAKLTNGLRNLNATASDFERLQIAADKFGNTTLFDQEDATQAFALLTSFQRIGVQSYERVTKAASDLATITGQDLKSAQIQLAKALEDPARRVTDLARSGTVFTDQQKEQIKVLQESGRLLEAQNLILKEIEKQYGGAAEAAGSAGLAGALDSLGEATRDFQEALGSTQSLIDGVTYIVNLLTEGVKGLEKGLKDADTIIKAVAIVSKQAGFGAEEFARGVEFLKQTILNALPQLRLYLFALEQVNKFARKVVDSQAGQRNFGMDYASQERALFEAAGGFNPYKTTMRIPPTLPTTKGKTPKGKTRGRSAEDILKDQLAAGERIAKQLQREIDLRNASNDLERELLRIKFNYEDVVANINANAAERQRQELLNLAERNRLDQENLVTIEARDKKLQEAFKMDFASLFKQDQSKLQKFISDSQDSLKDLEQVAINVSQGVGSAIADSLVNGIQGLIEGSTKVKDVFANLLKSVGQVLAQEGAKMIATYIAIGIAKAFAGLSGGTKFGEMGNFDQAVPGASGFSTPSSFNASGLFGRANGGPVASGRPYMVGERGPELFMPQQSGNIRSNEDLRALMGRSPAGTAQAMNFTFETTNIGGTEYVSREQLEAAMATTRRQAANDGAKRGMNMTLDRMQNSPRIRARVGIS